MNLQKVSFAIHPDLSRATRFLSLLKRNTWKVCLSDRASCVLQSTVEISGACVFSSTQNSWFYQLAKNSDERGLLMKSDLSIQWSRIIAVSTKNTQLLETALIFAPFKQATLSHYWDRENVSFSMSCKVNFTWQLVHWKRFSVLLSVKKVLKRWTGLVVLFCLTWP